MAGWYSPVPGASMTTPYGQPGSLWSSGHHTGADFAAASGSPVMAAVPGTVISTAWGGAYGNLVKVRHDDGSIGYYAHLQSISTRPGTRVERGALLGRVGTTGNSTGPHLHFEVRRGGKAVNPRGWLQTDYGTGTSGMARNTVSVQTRDVEIPEPEPMKLPGRATEGGGFIGTELDLEEQLEAELPNAGDLSGNLQD